MSQTIELWESVFDKDMDTQVGINRLRKMTYVDILTKWNVY